MTSLFEVTDGDLQLHPHPGQLAAWDSEKRFIIILAGTQGGKALDVDTLIPTPDGFRKLIDILVGDFVYGEDGKPAEVIHCSPVYIGNECYKITFDDGSELVADAEHLWKTQTAKERKNAGRHSEKLNPSWASRPQCSRKPTIGIRTTKELSNSVGTKKRRNHTVQLAKPIAGVDSDLPLKPYTLGVWLGDGLSVGARIYTADIEIIKFIEQDGYPVGEGRKSNSGKAKSYCVGSRKGRGGGYNPFLQGLRDIGVLGSKRIPESYLFSTVENRIELLRGLLDTDGWIEKQGQCAIALTNLELAEDVCKLITSLGIKVKRRFRTPKRGNRYLSMRFMTDIDAFKLPRKLAKQRGWRVRWRKSSTRNRAVVSVVKVPSVPVKCIAINSPSKLYLAGTSYIPTHNTSFLPWWLWNEICRCGAGDYLAVTATYDLFKLKLLPAIREVFENVMGVGRYWASDRVIELRDPDTGQFLAKRSDDPMWGRIILRSAESSGGLESSTAKAAVLDEAGMPSFTLETWEAVLRRLSLYRGRVLVGTTIYNLGWMKTHLYDKWERAKRNHPDIDVIQFDSIENPSFPQQEYNDRLLDMPRWRFDMMYRGRYTKPAGAIFDCFDTLNNTQPRFTIPTNWQTGLGLDFGGVNTAGVYFAHEPGTLRVFAYREYLKGGMTAKEHATEMMKGELRRPKTVGGSKGEGQWRGEFAAGGLGVAPPDQPDVEVGIQRVYGGFKRLDVILFDDLVGTIGQVNSYARKLGPDNEPTEEILNKDTYHYLDAMRYYLGNHFANVSTRSGLTTGKAMAGQGLGFGSGARGAPPRVKSVMPNAGPGIRGFR